MKILTTIILLTNIIFAKTISYDISADKKKIGTFTVKIEKLKNKHHRYNSHLKFSTTYMFIKYQYEYKENVLFDKDGLVEFVVEEFDDGDYKKMSAKKEGEKIVFSNGKEIEFSQIDTTPFEIGIVPDENSTKTKFSLKSFDALSGDLMSVNCQVLESKKVDNQMQYKIKKRNSIDNKVEILTITKEGKLLDVKGEDFQMKINHE